MSSRVGRFTGGVALSLCLSGCLTAVRVSPDFEPPRASSSREALLTVDATAVPWNGRALGRVVAEELVAVGSLAQVHYPVEPRNPPPIAIHIVASGEVDEHVAWGVFGSILVGASFFLLTPVIPFFDDLQLSSRVSVREGRRLTDEFDVEIEASIRHYVFWAADEQQREASDRAFRALAHRIAQQLGRP